MLPAARCRPNADSRSPTQLASTNIRSFFIRSDDANMSSVALPDSVGAGTVVCDLQLTGGDARFFVDRLRVAVERLVAAKCASSNTLPPCCLSIFMFF